MLHSLATPAFNSCFHCIVIRHGRSNSASHSCGAGVLTNEELSAESLNRVQFEQALADALTAGYAMRIRAGKSSVDVIEAAIRVMEDSPLFNAGHSAALTIDGRAELDAAIMDGNMKSGGDNLGLADPRRRAGAVAAVTHIKNPISAARAVMEMEGSRHVLLVGEGAELFSLSAANQHRYALERVSNAYFWTDGDSSKSSQRSNRSRTRAL